MKKFILLSIFFIFLISLYSNTDCEKIGLSGPVKNIVKTIYDDKNNVIKKYKFGFDKKGNLTDECIFDKDGSIISLQKYEHVYSKNNKTIKIFDFSNKLISLKKIIYDNMGIEKKELFLSKNGEIKKRIIFFYNEDGQLEKTVEYDNNYILSKKSIYKYNKNNHIIEISIVNPDGSLVIKNIYKYKNNYTQNTITTKLSKEIHNINFIHYDDYNNWLSSFVTSVYDDYEKPIKQINYREISYYEKENLFSEL